MGIRAHAVKKYVCEYAGGEEFNYLAEALYTGLTDHPDIDVGIHIWQADDMNDYSNWEINNFENAFSNYIEALEKLPPDEIFHPFRDNEDAAFYTNKEVAKVFREWEKHADRDDIIRIHWF